MYWNVWKMYGKYFYIKFFILMKLYNVNLITIKNVELNEFYLIPKDNF